MGWTTPNTRTTGYLVTATVYDNEIINNLIYLHGDGGAKVDLSGGGQTFRYAGLETVAASNTNCLRNYLLSGDTQPVFELLAQGAMQWGAGGSTAADVSINRVVNGPTGTGSFLEVIAGAGFGYGTGSGGTVTQATNRGTGVTLNKACGTITTNATSLANAGVVSFVVTNSVVGASDGIILTGQNTPASLLPYYVSNVGSGSFTITYTNNTGGATTTAYLFNFQVIKGATS